MAALIGALAVPRLRRRDNSAGSQSRRGPVRMLGGLEEAMEAPLVAIADNNFINIKVVNPYLKVPPLIPT